MQYISKKVEVIATILLVEICRLTLSHWRQFGTVYTGGQYVTIPYFISPPTIYDCLYGTTICDDASLHLIGWKLAKMIFLHILSPATIYVFWWQYVLYVFTYIVAGDNICRTTIYAVTGSLFCSVRRQQCRLFLSELYEYNQSRILKKKLLSFSTFNNATIKHPNIQKKQIYFLVIVNTKMHPDWRHAEWYHLGEFWLVYHGLGHGIT